MKIYIQQAKVICSTSAYHNQVVDILVDNGIITQIGENLVIDNADTTYQANGLCVSLGFACTHVNVPDPGLEHKEDLNSAVKAAKNGGFTAMGIQPGTTPPMQTKAAIEYTLAKTANSGVEAWPIGALFIDNQGKDLAELYDMQQAGAVAFSDAGNPVTDSGAMGRAMQYANGIGAVLMVFPLDKSMAAQGIVNEGVNATRLGLKTQPAIAEELMVARNIALAKYYGVGLHFSAISTAGSVALIAQAQADGLAITAGVHFYNVCLTDDVLQTFDSNYKTQPPLRTQPDVEALIQGLNDGVISLINTNHTPQAIEDKDVEFDFAGYGMLGLDVAFAALNTYVAPKIGIDKLVHILTQNPRLLLNRNIPTLAEGAAANLTLFNPTEEFTFGLSDIASKSRNTPFIGTTFTGRVVAVVTGV